MAGLNNQRKLLLMCGLVFASLASGCGSGTTVSAAGGDDAGTGETVTLPEDINLDLSGNLVMQEDDEDASLSASLADIRQAAVGQTSDFINEMTTAFATTFGSQGPVSLVRLELFAQSLNTAGVAVGNNCAADQDTEFRCTVEEDVTFESVAYEKVVRCYKDGERNVEWFLNNDGSTTNNGVLIVKQIIDEDHGGPEDVGDTFRGRIDYDVFDDNAKAVTHYETISRDDDATLVTSMIVHGLQNTAAGIIDLEAVFYGDYNGDDVPTTSHDLARHEMETNLTYMAGISYNQHIQEPGDEDDEECIDDSNTVVDASECSGLEVDISDVTFDPAYDQSVTEIAGVSLDFTSDFAEDVPADLAETECTEIDAATGTDTATQDSPDEETIAACEEAAGIDVETSLVGDLTEEELLEFCLCVGEDFGMDEAQCTEMLGTCESTDTVNACFGG